MADSRRTSVAPWIIAGVAGLVLAALLIAYFVFLVPYRRDHVPGTLASDEQAAISAGATETANVLSYRRAKFQADFDRALAGSTGGLQKDLASKKAQTLKVMTQGKFDLSAEVTHEALLGPLEKSGQSGYVVLVTVNGFRSNEPNAPMQESLKVTVVRVDGKWLASDISQIGIQ